MTSQSASCSSKANHSTEAGELLTRAQLGRLLGLSPDSLDRYVIHQPNFPCVLVGKMRRYPRTAVLRFVNDIWPQQAI